MGANMIDNDEATTDCPPSGGRLVCPPSAHLTAPVEAACAQRHDCDEGHDEGDDGLLVHLIAERFVGDCAEQTANRADDDQQKQPFRRVWPKPEQREKQERDEARQRGDQKAQGLVHRQAIKSVWNSRPSLPYARPTALTLARRTGDQPASTVGFWRRAWTGCEICGSGWADTQPPDPLFADEQGLSPDKFMLRNPEGVFPPVEPRA